MPWNILLLPLLGGFYYCIFSHKLRFKLRRLDGNRLVFYASLYGLFSLAAALVLTFLFHGIRGLMPPPVVNLLDGFDQLWQAAVPLPHLRKAGLAFFVAVLFTHWQNRSVNEQHMRLEVLREEGDRLELLLARALEGSKPLLITLASRKVYLVSLLNGFFPELDRKHIEVLPLRSGYRAQDSLEVVFTTDYVALYQQLSKAGNTPAMDGFQLVLRASDIVSATIFDPDYYDQEVAAKLDSKVATKRKTKKPPTGTPAAPPASSPAPGTG